jgi:hypothetical protein
MASRVRLAVMVATIGTATIAAGCGTGGVDRSEQVVSSGSADEGSSFAQSPQDTVLQRPGQRQFVDRPVPIALDHLGKYEWSSDPLTLDGPPASFGVTRRVDGSATIDDWVVSGDVTDTGYVLRLTWTVTELSGSATLVILDAPASESVASPVPIQGGSSQ